MKQLIVKLLSFFCFKPDIYPFTTRSGRPPRPSGIGSLHPKYSRQWPRPLTPEEIEERDTPYIWRSDLRPFWRF